MVTPDMLQIDPFWDDEYQNLEYISETFNNPQDVEYWLRLGYPSKFTGDMCDMRSPQPSWNHRFIEHFEMLGWKDIGTSYYRMSPGTILPEHQDTYKKYIEIFNLHGREQSIRRAVVFLESWKSGHYLEISNIPIVNWPKGFCAAWIYDTPHLAANMGTTPRYTLQITGHV